MSDKEVKEQARLAYNRYHREYRAKNRERIKKNNELYWARKAEQFKNERADIENAEC